MTRYRRSKNSCKLVQTTITVTVWRFEEEPPSLLLPDLEFLVGHLNRAYCAKSSQARCDACRHDAISEDTVDVCTGSTLRTRMLHRIAITRVYCHLSLANDYNSSPRIPCASTAIEQPLCIRVFIYKPGAQTCFFRFSPLPLKDTSFHWQHGLLQPILRICLSRCRLRDHCQRSAMASFLQTLDPPCSRSRYQRPQAGHFPPSCHLRGLSSFLKLLVLVTDSHCDYRPMELKVSASQSLSVILT